MFFRKPYKSLDEFYKAVQELISALRANGNDTEAAHLEAVFNRVCTTSSELIGELMMALGKMNHEYSKDIRKRIKDCHYFAKHYRRILGLY